MIAPTAGPANPLVMILFDDKLTLDPARVMHVLERLHPDHCQNQPLAADFLTGRTTVLRFDGHQPGLITVDAPLPEQIVRGAHLMGADAADILARHRAHVVVGVKDIVADALVCARVLTAVAGAVIASHEDQTLASQDAGPQDVGSQDVGSRDVGSRDAGSRDVSAHLPGAQTPGAQTPGAPANGAHVLGAMWDGKVTTTAAAWQHLSPNAYKPYPDLPIDLWIRILRIPVATQGQAGFLTRGLDRFAGWELEMTGPDTDPRQLALRARSVARHLVQNGPIFQDGMTYQISPTEQLSIQIGPSANLQGMEVMSAALSLIEPQAITA